ncbi:putative Phosphoglucosamine mutase [Streptomyces misionensis JCM 4497]
MDRREHRGEGGVQAGLRLRRGQRQLPVGPRRPPAEDLLGHPAEVGGRQGRRGVHERPRRQRQVRPAPAARPAHRQEGLERPGRRRRALRQRAQHRTRRRRRHADGRPLGVGHGVRHRQRQEAVRQEALRRLLLPGRLRGRLRPAGAGGVLRRRHRHRARRDPGTRPGHRQGEVDPAGQEGLAGRPGVLDGPAGRLSDQREQEDVEHLRLHQGRQVPLRGQGGREVRPHLRLGDPRPRSAGLPGCRGRRRHALPAHEHDRERQRDRGDQPRRRQGEVAGQVPRRRADVPDEDRGRQAHRVRAAVVRHGRPGRVDPDHRRLAHHHEAAAEPAGHRADRGHLLRRRRGLGRRTVRHLGRPAERQRPGEGEADHGFRQLSPARLPFRPTSCLPSVTEVPEP